MPAVQAILWDVGGTLVDNRVTMAESIRARLAVAGVGVGQLSDDDLESTFEEFFALEDRWRTLADEERDVKAYFRGLLAPLGLTSEQFEVAYARVPPYYDLHKPVDGIRELLADLRGRGLRQTVVSNWPPSLVPFLEHHRLAEYFEAVVFSAQDGVKKPDSRIFLRALATLGISASEALFIGDHRHLDILPARALGMRAIHFDPRNVHEVAEARTVAELRPLILAMVT
jgi:HAD superfamily hydrolase (TIGR01549 family)